MISFKERKISPAADTVKVRMASGSDTLSVAFSTNFEFTVSWEAEWLKMAQDTVSRESLIFMSEPNTSDKVRTCTVKVSPKDNPGFVCKTFVVMQATNTGTSVSYDSDLPDDFSFDPSDPVIPVLSAPAAGGEAIIWIYSSKVVDQIQSDKDWLVPSIVPNEGLNKLIINVGANESENPRSGEIKVRIGGPVATFTIKQAGKTAGE